VLNKSNAIAMLFIVLAILATPAQARPAAEPTSFCDGPTYDVGGVRHINYCVSYANDCITTLPLADILPKGAVLSCWLQYYNQGEYVPSVKLVFRKSFFPSFVYLPAIQGGSMGEPITVPTEAGEMPQKEIDELEALLRID
jgi:hypothetical protein